jgi:hypothetical protein
MFGPGFLQNPQNPLSSFLSIQPGTVQKSV